LFRHLLFFSFMPLYLVATPIGNLEDITLRALRILGEADLIACEDTRRTRRLLDHYRILRPTVSFHEHNETERSAELVKRLIAGEKIALVSDAGTPGVSDPAYRLVAAALASGIAVIPVPGPVAAVSALIASGLPTDEFHFAGFLPHKAQARKSRLEQLGLLRSTLVFYEAPHRIRYALEDALEALGDRQAAIARELTKIHEEFVRGKLSDLIQHFRERQPRGEMTLVIAGAGDDNFIDADSTPLSERVHRLMDDEGLSRNEALKRAARALGLSKKAAYRLLLEEQENAGKENHQNGDEQHNRKDLEGGEVGD
jgi:16S rRNA (cytidine1402-2'-O)-methyltransferase